MQEPKRGMLVRVLQAEEPYFKAGTLARLAFQDFDGDWWAEFSGCGNALEDYLTASSGTTKWCIGEFGTDFELT